MKILKTDLDFIRERLTAPFGFKGRYLKELWQPVVKLETEGFTAVCPSVQSVLWADAKVFASMSPAASNALMFAVTSRATKLLTGMTFTTPKEALDIIFPQLKAYAKELCGFEVDDTFVLNSLVGIDFALWSLFAKENKIKDFDGIIPSNVKPAMSSKNPFLARIPLINYSVDDNGIDSLLQGGASLIKIKIGASVDTSSPENDMRSMVEWDKKRLAKIHSMSKKYSTGSTKSKNVLYYLDANCRYDSKQRLYELLDFADSIGALERIAILEEPFSLTSKVDVSDLPVPIAADESAHSLKDVKERLSLGYKAIALKPIAKTLSISFDMVAAAREAGAMCFCADLTVNPLLTEWNKQFAARLTPLDGMLCGCVEVNGDMNYVNWDGMKSLLPNDYPYTEEKGGSFQTNSDFFARGAKLFDENGYNFIFK